jgi:hypothetical protein
MNNHNVETCRKKNEETTVVATEITPQIKNHKRHFHMHVTFVVGMDIE